MTNMDTHQLDYRFCCDELFEQPDGTFRWSLPEHEKTLYLMREFFQEHEGKEDLGEACKQLLLRCDNKYKQWFIGDTIY